jgi:chaperonin GroEL
MRVPVVVPAPEASALLQSGFDRLAALIASTLGPTGGVVLVASVNGSRPEPVRNGAVLARRVMQLPGRGKDVGAMMLRHLVWQTHLHAGDGAATAAVLAQAILGDALRHRAAGADARTLRRGIDRAVDAAKAALRQMARPVRDEVELEGVARAVTGEENLSSILAEMFDVLGPEGHVTVEDYVSAYLDREYHEGGRWNGRVASAYFLSDHSARRAVRTACRIALFDGTVSSIEDARSLAEAVTSVESRSVALFARAFTDTALGPLVVNHQRRTIEVVAVQLLGPRITEDLDDLAALTGSRVLSAATGQSLRSITAADLGSARRVEVDPSGVAVVGGGGTPVTIQSEIGALRGRLEGLATEDDERDRLHFRLARLSGRTGVLKIGAATGPERNTLRQVADQGVRVLPLALREGIVPGGGVAFLNCIPTVQGLAAEGDEAGGITAVLRALEEPFRRIAHNSGAPSPGFLLSEARRLGPSYGYDVLNKRIIDMEDASILDAAGVLSRALEAAAGGAAAALSIDTMVLRRSPKMSPRP